LHLGGVPIPATLPFPSVQNIFNDEGSPCDPKWNRRAHTYLEELLWFTEAMAEQRRKYIAL
jgi:hypothetical protein